MWRPYQSLRENEDKVIEWLPLNILFLNQGAWNVQTFRWTVQQFLKCSFINSNSPTSKHPLKCPKISKFPLSRAKHLLVQSKISVNSSKWSQKFQILKFTERVLTSQIFQIFLKCSNILNVSLSPQKALERYHRSSVFQHLLKRPSLTSLLKVPISWSSDDATSRPPIIQNRFLIWTTQKVTCILYRKLLDLGNEETCIYLL